MSGHLHRLSNGFTVAVEPMPGVESVSVGVYADVGARSEAVGAAGLAHMVEHMVFKGAGGRDARGIAEAAEDVGGQLNAWTSRDQTVFHGRFLGGDLPLAVDLLADLLRAPHFADDDLEREKGVVLAELGEARDTPDDIVFDHLQAAAFADQPLGAPVLGTEASIAAITAADLRGWAATQYRPSNLILAAAGKVDPHALLGLAEARFADMDAGRAPAAAPAAWTGGTTHDRRRFDQTNLLFAHPVPGNLDRQVHALALFANAAGEGASSRLFQEVREKRGLAYSVYSWVQTWADTGMLGVHLATARADAAQAHGLARDVLAATAEGLTQAELDRARAQMKAGLLMGLEGVGARADYLARRIQLYGRVRPVAEMVELLDAVTVADARAAGRRALSGPVALASVGGGKLAKAA